MRLSRSSKRGARGGKRLDLSDLRLALQDGRVWSGLGVVHSPDGGSHYELSDDDLLIEVKLMPGGEHITCRMGAAAGGPGRGVWAIPAVGTEVAVMIPQGELEADPIIVATLSSQSVPSGLDADTLLVVAPKVVIKAGEVTLGDGVITKGVLTGSDVDPILDLPYEMLGLGSGSVKATP